MFDFIDKSHSFTVEWRSNHSFMTTCLVPRFFFCAKALIIFHDFMVD